VSCYARVMPDRGRGGRRGRDVPGLGPLVLHDGCVLEVTGGRHM